MGLMFYQQSNFKIKIGTSMKKLTYLLISSLLFSAFIHAEVSGYIINNVQLVDGSGAEPKLASVIITNDKIQHIAWGETKLPNPNNYKTIEGENRVLTPGFIDLHAHGNPLTHGQFANFIAMGVTSISLGQDGFSRYIEDFEGWRGQVADSGVGVNLIPFIGHGSLRVIAGIGQNPEPTAVQLNNMLDVLDKLLPHTFGMTTGLEYNPALFAKTDELLALAKKVGEHNRVIMSHLRNEDDDQLFKSIDELMQQSEFARVHISHLKSVYGKGAFRAQEIIKHINQYKMTADLYPYNASYTGIALLFPKWAKTQEQVNKLNRTQIQALLEHLKNRVLSRNGPEATLLGSGKFAGLTLKQVADKLNKPFESVLLEDIGPHGASAAYFIMDNELQQHLIRAPWLSFSSDGSPTMFHPRGYGSFAKVIDEYVNKLGLLSLPQAINKMTGQAANILRLDKRGLIKEGHYADLLLFDPKQVKAMASYENPHQLSQGFEFVWVNGQLIKQGSDIKGLAGKVLSPKAN